VWIIIICLSASTVTLVLLSNDLKLEPVASTRGIFDIAQPDAVIMSHLLVQ
jgi:hypothetical protein